MTSKEALENITDWIEYFTRLDFVEPIVRGEVQQKFYEAYHKTRPELELIEKDLKVLEQLKEILSMNYLVRVYGYEMADRLQTYLKSNDAVKRWLDGKD